MSIFRKTPEIIVPRAEFKLRGEYTLRRIKADSNDVVQELTFDNLITNAGLNRMATDTVMGMFAVGTGTATPLGTDTALQSVLAVKSEPGSSAVMTAGVTPDWIGQTVYTTTFSPGAATGNISEVGVGWSTGSPLISNYTLFSRALILDSGGFPVAITVLADEYLQVTYTIYCHRDVSDQTYTFDVSNVTHTVTTQRPCRLSLNAIGCFNAHRGGMSAYSAVGVNTSATALVAVTGAPSWSERSITFSADAYTGGTYKRTGSVTFSPGTGNLAGGIGLLYCHFSSSTLCLHPEIQMKITPAIAKDATKALVLNTEVSWGRYTP